MKHAGRVVGVLGLRRVEGGEGVVEFGVEDGPEGCQVHWRGFENERSEEHVDF